MSIATISPTALAQRHHEDPQLEVIDVRTPVEFREVHLQFARNIPLDQLDPKAVIDARNGSSGKPLYLICKSGGRGQKACEMFEQAGYSNVVNVEGGTQACAAAGLPVTRGKKAISLSGKYGSRPARWSSSAPCSAGWFTRPSLACRPWSEPDWFLRALLTPVAWACCWPACPGTNARLLPIHAKSDRSQIGQSGRCGVRNSTYAKRKSMKLVIVGGVAGVLRRRHRARRLSEKAHIVLVERGPDVSFANCGLPYYLGGAIADRAKLLVVTPARLLARFNLDVRVNSSVESIDRQAKTVQIRDLASGRQYDESYDKLVLAPGAAPLRPPVPGIDLPGIFTLRSLQDTDRIKAALDRGVQQAVVIGAGFIGLELVENLVRQGIATTLVELQDQVLPPLDKEMTTPLAEALAAHGVSLLLGDSAEAFEPAADGLIVRLKSGKQLPASLVILGVGVRPENQLAVDASLEVGPRGGIRVNEYLETSDPNIYAVGDAIEVRDTVSGAPTQVPLAGPANRQGRIAADNIFGRRVRYRGTQGTAIVGLFGCVAGMTGASEKALRRAGRPFRMVYVHPAQHAGYYPGAQPMTLKLLFDPAEGRILGAQAVGGEGVDKRIDVLAVAIQAGMTVFDLEEMELAYAPQFGSAKDPINMAGFVASGLLRGDHPQIDVGSLMSISPADRPLLLDVRTAEEFAAGHLPAAINIPVDELRRASTSCRGIERLRPTAKWASAVIWRPASCVRLVCRRRTSAADTRPTSSGIRVLPPSRRDFFGHFARVGAGSFGTDRVLSRRPSRQLDQTTDVKKMATT